MSQEAPYVCLGAVIYIPDSRILLSSKSEGKSFLSSRGVSQNMTRSYLKGDFFLAELNILLCGISVLTLAILYLFYL